MEWIKQHYGPPPKEQNPSKHQFSMGKEKLHAISDPSFVSPAPETEDLATFSCAALRSLPNMSLATLELAWTSLLLTEGCIAYNTQKKKAGLVLMTTRFRFASWPVQAKQYGEIAHKPIT